MGPRRIAIAALAALLALAVAPGTQFQSKVAIRFVDATEIGDLPTPLSDGMDDTSMDPAEPCADTEADGADTGGTGAHSADDDAAWPADGAPAPPAPAGH